MARNAPLATLASPRDLWLGNAARYERYASHFPAGSATRAKWEAKAEDARRQALTYKD